MDKKDLKIVIENICLAHNQVSEMIEGSAPLGDNDGEALQMLQHFFCISELISSMGAMSVARLGQHKNKNEIESEQIHGGGVNQTCGDSAASQGTVELYRVSGSDWYFPRCSLEDREPESQAG